ncbi:MAG TPA: TolC family protein [Gemmatimonadales bacterium]|nr:TolC family protein [Gemmatimonadales bacterium]
MIGALLLALQVAAGPAAPQDTLPRVTLAEALERATRLDPNYVAALGQVDNAEWGRRNAIMAFVVPSLTLSTSYTQSTSPSFNFGTGGFSKQFVQANAVAQYEVFDGGRRIFELQRAKADLEGARASELEARFLAALATERAYYDVLGGRELLTTARDRTRRAEEQLATARARVLSGAAVQTDSLTLLLELQRSRVDELRQAAVVDVARLELGRRIGLPGPVDAESLPDEPTTLPISLEAAVALALEQGPQYRIARANERAAVADLRAERSAYLPQILLTGQRSSFDTRFWPDATNRGQFSITATLPVWDLGRRELFISQARVRRDVNRAIRADLELAARRDVAEAYQAFEVAVAAAAVAREAVIVGRENYRVQDARYRAGASTILDLLEAQVSLSGAESGLVQARYAALLARAGLEVIVGRRLTNGQDTQ